MKKIGTLMAAAMIFAGTATFAAAPVHAAKATTTKTATVNAKQQEKPKAVTTPHAKKAHKKHHVKKAAK